MSNNTLLMMHKVRADANKHLKAHGFIERLRKYADKLTMNEYKELRTQALDGDIEGASLKLNDILMNKSL